MFKLLVFFIIVFFVYRWYRALKKAVKTHRDPSPHPPSPRRFDISRVEEAEFRDLSDDNGSVKNE